MAALKKPADLDLQYFQIRINIYLSLSTSEIWVRLVPSNMFKPSRDFFTDRSEAVLLLWIFYLFICVSCRAVLSVPCSRLVTCWECADLLTLLFVMFSCVFVTFPIWCPGSSAVFDCMGS